MMRPAPFLLYCKKCNHSEVVKPKSDAIRPSEVTRFCPTCQMIMERKEELSVFDKLKLLVFKH
ncbi:MAG: hypothetical protein KBE02_04340 [Sulfurospirillum sp.]|nr:hypothetical protein [Sulfurospirillum sp.]